MPTTTLSPLIPISAIFFLFFKYLHSCISVISRICFSPAHLYKQSWREKNRRKIRKNKKKTIWNYTPKTRNSTKRRLLTWLFSSHSLSLHCFSFCVCRLCTRYYYYYYMFFSLLFSVCFPACYIYVFPWGYFPILFDISKHFFRSLNSLFKNPCGDIWTKNEKKAILKYFQTFCCFCWCADLLWKGNVLLLSLVCCVYTKWVPSIHVIRFYLNKEQQKKVSNENKKKKKIEAEQKM